MDTLYTDETSEPTERPTSELEKIFEIGDTFIFLKIEFTVARFSNELHHFGMEGGETDMHVIYNGNGKLCRTVFNDRDLPVMLKTMKT